MDNPAHLPGGSGQNPGSLQSGNLPGPVLPLRLRDGDRNTGPEMAIFKGAMMRTVRRALPYIQPIGSSLMVVAGMYIVFYWSTIGGLLF